MLPWLESYLERLAKNPQKDAVSDASDPRKASALALQPLSLIYLIITPWNLLME